jgi:two-component system, chemotaxis family, chemotaxis protein CheY
MHAAGGRRPSAVRRTKGNGRAFFEGSLRGPPQNDNLGKRTRQDAMQAAASKLGKLVQTLDVLIVDDNQYMRKVVRNLLVNLGVKNVHEAADGISGLDAIRMYAPNVVILDWEMPLLNGAELVRIVRSPGVFPVPDVPIIMLTGHGERWRVMEAARLGVNEFLIKPVSGKALLDRIVSIVAKPRKMVRHGEYYGPAPRKLFGDGKDTRPVVEAAR